MLDHNVAGLATVPLAVRAVGVKEEALVDQQEIPQDTALETPEIFELDHPVRTGLAERLGELHEELRLSCPSLCRIAIVLYDSETDLLKTFVHSTIDFSPLQHYEARLSETPTLKRLVEERKSRVVNNIGNTFRTKSHHNKMLKSGGFRSSYTIPVFHHDNFIGFLFFNSSEVGFFNSGRLEALHLYVDLLTTLIVNELLPVRTLKGALQTANAFSLHRDDETGTHLQRMCRYARIIARDIAPRFNLSDEYVEYLFQFTPLHDVGKIAIPDGILLKPGKLTEEEFSIMQSHVLKGVEIIDAIVENFNLRHMPHIAMLRNIVAYHHEGLDGSGYPYGLSGEAIPIEARITAVADVYDALTTERPYKNAWSHEDAMAFLRSSTKLDPRCVDVLAARYREVKEIKATFA